MPKEFKTQDEIDKSLLKEEQRNAKFVKQNIKQVEKEKDKELKKSKKREIVLLRQKMQSELNKSRIKRDNLLSKLSKKLEKAKLKENVLKAKVKEQAIKDKKEIIQEKADDRVEISELKKIIRQKKLGILEDKRIIKKEISLTAVEIKNKKLLNKKQNIEDQNQARIIKKEQKEMRRKQTLDLKLKNKELKIALEEKRMIQKNLNQEKLNESKRLIAEEKLRISEEKEKLRFIKNEKAALSKAKRLEKLEKAKDEKIRIKEEKNLARELHKKEVVAIKSNKVKNDIANAIEINLEKEILQKEVEKINTSIEIEKQEILETKSEAREKMLSPLPAQDNKEKEDFSDKYESAFDKEDANEVELEAKDSTIERISGSVISSFGKKGANKFKVAQKESIESDIEKYKKDIASTEMILNFRKEKPEAIRVKSLTGYIEIITGNKFTKDEIDSFHAHAITAILTSHSIRFADGYISPLKNGKKLVLEFSRELDESKTFVEFKNIEIGEEINKLITKKINAGGSILLAKGLIAIKEPNGFKFLQDTNFMKA